jgi:hypothetical protein
MPRMKLWLWRIWVGVSAGIILFLSLAWLAYPTWVMQAPAIPYWRMNAMKQGMDRQEVQDLLGTPTSRHADLDGSETWTYSRGTWAIFYVYFSPEGVVKEYVHDF